MIDQKHPFDIGKSYLIRTVTNYFTGRLTAVYDTELVLEDAAWIADTGRFSNCFKTGHLDEVEPLEGKVIIGRTAIIDCTEWTLPLPREQV